MLERENEGESKTKREMLKREKETDKERYINEGR